MSIYIPKLEALEEMYRAARVGGASEAFIEKCRIGMIELFAELQHSSSRRRRKARKHLREIIEVCEEAAVRVRRH
jgi:hypothetical protein